MGNYETSTVYYQGVITQISKLLTVMEEPARQAKWRDIQAELAQEGTCQEHSDLSLILHQGRSVISSFQAGRGGAHQRQGHLEPALPPPSQGGGT